MTNVLKIAKELREHLGSEVSLEGNVIKAPIVPHVTATLCRVGENKLGNTTVYFNKNFLKKHGGEKTFRQIQYFCKENDYLCIKEESSQEIPHT